MEEILNNYESYFAKFVRGSILSQVTNAIPEKKGVYLLYSISNIGKKQLVYIGKAGTLIQEGTWKKQGLYGRLNAIRDGMRSQQYFENKIRLNQLAGIEIDARVTFDDNHKDIPGFVEAKLLKMYHSEYGMLPLWNKTF